MPQTRAVKQTRNLAPGKCSGNTNSAVATIKLPVIAADGIRESRSGRRRAIVLAVVHVLILAHVLHWLWTGRTLSPIEPSEAKDLAMKGIINTGFIFFSVAILSTLILGRFFCGWGCHLIAYQDLTLWVLKKLHLRPRAFRSRFLIFVPLIAAGYMFFWPWIYRLWFGHEQPHLAVHLSTTGFWSTFPSYGVAILTILVCGVAIIYFLGPKGFCTYACPYGGIFGAVDQFAVGRIRVTDDCHQCGHCTAVCTSNVDVAREVNLYGMVVDPGCMKCLDCVSVCPNDALYVGFGLPAVAARQRVVTAAKPAKKYDLTLTEELIAAVIFACSFFAFRGLYGKIPFLMSLGAAGIFTFVMMKALAMLQRPDAMLQKLRLKVNGRIQPAGYPFMLAAALFLAFTIHSGYWQYHDTIGQTAFAKLPGEDLGWQHRPDFAAKLTPTHATALADAMTHLQTARRWGLFPVENNDLAVSWLHLLNGDHQRAIGDVRNVLADHPDDIGLLLKLGTYEVSAGRMGEAKAAFERALAVEKVERERLHRKLPDEPVPMSGLAWAEWGLFLASQNRPDEARTALLEACRFDPASPALWNALGQFELSTNRIDAARRALIKAVDIAPAYHVAQQGLESLAKQPQDFPAALRDYDNALADHPKVLVLMYNRAFALTELKRLDEAIAAYREILRIRPQVTAAHVDLGALLMVRGDLPGAIEQYEEVIRQAPNEPEMAMRLAFLYVQVQRVPEAEPLLRRAAQYGTPPQRAAALDALKQIGK